MRHSFRWVFAIFSAVLVVACAYDGSELAPGRDLEADVVRAMGVPAMRWQDPDGAVQLSFPRGPMGVHSFMAFLKPDGRLARIENVMDAKAFARIERGMDREAVSRVLGPPAWTSYFKRRDELVWEWRYCNDWNEPAHFMVLFDGSRGSVRSTMDLTESQLGLCGIDGGCICAR